MPDRYKAQRDAARGMIETLRLHGRAPNVFIIGAQKCGTTSLADALNASPQFFLTPVKEPNFFCFDIRPQRFATAFRQLQIEDEWSAIERSKREEVLYAYFESPDAYAALFEGAEAFHVRADASVTYLYSAEAADAIADLVPDAKIIVILRDPIRRALSHWRMQRRAGIETEGDFVSAVLRDHAEHTHEWGRKHLYVEAGLYARQLRPYVDRFPRNCIHILFLETLLSDKSAEHLREVERFLGLAQTSIARLPPKNAGRDARSAAFNQFLYRSGLKRAVQRVMPYRIKELGKRIFYSTTEAEASVDTERLRPLFASDSAELEEMIGSKVPWTYHQ